jgi:hypothetical protein
MTNILYLSESGHPSESQKSKVRIFLSESGCPGFEDFQDVIDKLFVGIFEI